MQRHINDVTARHLDVGNILVEERLKDDHLITRLDKCHKGTEHAFVRSSGDRNLGLRVQRAAPVRSICIRNSLLETRPALCE